MNFQHQCPLIKFYWNTAMCLPKYYLRLGFCALTAKLRNWDRPSGILMALHPLRALRITVTCS